MPQSDRGRLLSHSLLSTEYSVGEGALPIFPPVIARVPPHYACSWEAQARHQDPREAGHLEVVSFSSLLVLELMGN